MVVLNADARPEMDEDFARAQEDVRTSLLMAVAASLIANPPTALTVVEIHDEAGQVTLTGEVASQALCRHLEEIASGHPGVVEIINQLAVRPRRDKSMEQVGDSPCQIEFDGTSRWIRWPNPPLDAQPGDF
jgi:hypothetical protein